MPPHLIICDGTPAESVLRQSRFSHEYLPAAPFHQPRAALQILLCKNLWLELAGCHVCLVKGSYDKWQQLYKLISL